MSLKIENYLPVVRQNGGLATDLPVVISSDLTVTGTTNIGTVSLIDLTTTGNTTLGNAVTDTTAINGATTITSTSANALTVGRQGATDPVLKIDASTASVATGISIVGAAAASGVAIAAISSGAAENLTINAKGTGTIGIGSVSTGIVTITPATTVSGRLTVGAALVATTETVTGSGAISIITYVSKLNTTGGGTYTLADGINGQLKVIALDVDSGTDAVITPTTKTGFTTITMDAVGDGVTLLFVTTRGWICVGNNGAVLA